MLWQWFLSRDGVVTDEIWSAYGTLDRSGALLLAERATGVLEVSPAGGRPEQRARRNAALDALEAAAWMQPGVLGGLHGRLLDAGILDQLKMPGVLFHRADPGVHDRLVALADGVIDRDARDNLLRALAWIDHDVVRATFARWVSDTPPWLAELASWHGASAVGPLLEWVTADAGWSVGRDGGRRGLYRWSGRILRTSGDRRAASVGGRLDDDACPWCGAALTVLVDVALDHHDTAFLELSGRRLRIPTCEFCGCGATLYFDVDLDGGAQWSEATRRPAHLNVAAAGDGPHIAPGVLGLADPLTTPFGGLGVGARSDRGGSSRIGGMPGWIQNPDYPSCPSCGELMPFLAEIDTGAVAWGEGAVYTFLDPRCRIAATVYQQT